MKGIQELLQAGFPKAWKNVFDPQKSSIRKWRKFMLFLCVISVLVDPLFLYVLVINGAETCLSSDKNLETTTSVLRSIMDAFYMSYMVLRFRIGFWVSSSQLPGTRVFVDDFWVIARRYLLSSSFLIDFLAVLPIPQVAIWMVIPKIPGSKVLITKDVLKISVLAQLAPRLLRINLVYKEITKTSSTLPADTSTRTTISLFLYVIAGQVTGSLWYLFSVERKFACWRDACQIQVGCNHSLLYCDESYGHPSFQNLTYLHDACSVDSQDDSAFNFGIYSKALSSGVMQSRDVLPKVSYCFWWAIQNLSSLGQNLDTSTDIWEICFAFTIFVYGLILFSFLVGILQSFLLSSTKWQNVENWMSENGIPDNLRKRIRQHQRYRMDEGYGIDTEALLHNLPKDLRRDTKRHLYFGLLSKVPILEKLETQYLDAMCDCLKPVLYAEESIILQQGDPIDKMIFLVRGNLISFRPGPVSIDSRYLKPGNCCGEELLIWGLTPPDVSSNLPISTTTIKACTEVEALALMADDINSILSRIQQEDRYRINHFRFYSSEWRCWAASTIQAAWRNYRRKKMNVLIITEPSQAPGIAAGDSVIVRRRNLSFGKAGICHAMP